MKKDFDGIKVILIFVTLFGFLFLGFHVFQKDDRKEHCYEVHIEYVGGQVETRYMFCTKSEIEHAKDNLIDVYEFCGFGNDYVRVTYKETNHLSEENCSERNPF